jgi:hypothetical protein
MRQWIRSHLTFANVVSLGALFVALGGTTYAATGGNFILGQSNSASSTTSLTRTDANTGKGLQVTNTSTGTGATALGLSVASGHPPFTVNSGTRVTNLNADKLDGIDSGGFVRGKGAHIVSGRITTPIDTTCCPEHTFLTVPNFGTLEGQCAQFNLGTYVGFHHTNGSDWLALERYDGSNPVIVNQTGSFTQLTDADNTPTHITAELARGTGASAITATIDVYTTYDQTNGCVFLAHAVVNQGS